MDCNALQKAVAQYCAAHRISGVLRITHRDRILHEQCMGFADHARKLPFTPHAMFSFYSLSKPFCAIGLLKLADKGLLDLDAHPARYLPEASGFDARLCIRQLLHHTSGIPDFMLTEGFSATHAPAYDPQECRAQLPALATYPPFFAPGTAGKYANVNFTLCALLIEALTHTPYDVYMKNEVFLPLGTATATIDRKGLEIPHRVKGYDRSGNDLVEVPVAYAWMLGGGDVVGTVDDVYCLNKAIKHRLLLKPETWDAVLTPSPLNKMGMGCTVSDWHGKTRIRHNGGHTGFRTLHAQLPEDDLDIILLSNSGFGDARKELSELIYSAFYNEESPAGEEPIMDAGYIK